MVKLIEEVEARVAKLSGTDEERERAALFDIMQTTPEMRGCLTQEERKAWYSIIRAARRRLEALDIIKEFGPEEKTVIVSHIHSDHLGRAWMEDILHKAHK